LSARAANVFPAAEKQASRSLTAEDYRRFLPIVRRTAMKLARRLPSHISVADLTGYAWLGLIEAYARAAPEMDKEEFEAYALYRIRGAMLDHLRTLDPQTRAGRAASRKLTRMIASLSTRLGRAPEEEEIARELGMDVEGYRKTLSDLDRAGMSRIEMLDIDVAQPPDLADLPEETTGKREIGAAVARAIAALPERMQQILALYYLEECTLKQIGEIFDVTESRISQLHTEAVHRIRAAIGKE
jgi:RNA polymerase sigma factor for flagellar operon FliA